VLAQNCRSSLATAANFRNAKFKL